MVPIHVRKCSGNHFFELDELIRGVFGLIISGNNELKIWVFHEQIALINSNIRVKIY